MYPIGEIEDAIISALQPLKTSLGVRTIKGYQGELEGLAAQDVRVLMLRAPAIFVVYGGSQFSITNVQIEERMIYHVAVVDQNFRGEKQARRGGLAGHPGTYAMLEGVRGELLNNAFGLQILPLEIVSQDPVFFAEGISVYSATYQTEQVYQEDYSGT